MPRELDLHKLNKFTTKKPAQTDKALEEKVIIQENTKKPANTQPWPSREPKEEQINIRGPADIINRFKKMAKNDRRAYYDMLQILMDEFEASS